MNCSWELDDVKIVQADLPEYLVNSQLDPSYGWRFFTNSWDGTIGNMYVMDGEIILVIRRELILELSIGHYNLSKIRLLIQSS